MISVAKKAKVSNLVEVVLRGGPCDGRKIMMDGRSTPQRFRLAFPEWCNYYAVGGGVYEYRDDEWVPVPIAL